MQERLWYFLENNAQQGPVAESQLRHLLSTGQLSGDTLVWSDLLAEWTAASEVQALALQGAPSAAMTLTPSELLLLFGDQFAQKVGMIGWGNHSTLLSGAPVGNAPLSELLFAAAILANERAGLIRLNQTQTKALFGLVKGQALTVELHNPHHPWPAESLEARLLPVMAQRGLTVQQLVSHFLQQDQPNPWSYSVAIVVDGLARRGLALVDPRGAAGPTDALLAQVHPSMTGQVHQLLSESQQRGVLHGLLMEGIKSGIKARKEHDNDHDWPDRD